MNPKSKKFAITGGIGSGKSAVADIVRAAGYPVFSCDEINAELWQDAEYLSMLANDFPQCTEGGEIVKKRLSELIFHNAEARGMLNALAHRRIMARLFVLMDEREVSFAEVPLLFECGLEGSFDGVIAVVREKEARVQAVVSRDGLSREDVLARIKSQFDYGQIGEKQCEIVQNDSSLSQLKINVQLAINRLLQGTEKVF